MLWETFQEKGGSQTAGIPLVTSEGSVSPVRQTAEHTEAEVNIDLLQPAIGGANAGKFNRGSFDFAEGMGKVSERVKVVKDMTPQLNGKTNTVNTVQTNTQEKRPGIDTIEYESIGRYGLPTNGEYIIDRSTEDTLKKRPAGTNYYYKYNGNGEVSY